MVLYGIHRLLSRLHCIFSRFPSQHTDICGNELKKHTKTIGKVSLQYRKAEKRG